MSDREFAIRDADMRFAWALFGLAALGVACGAAVMIAQHQQTLSLVPVLVGAIALVAVILPILRRRRVTLAGGNLKVLAGINSRTVAIADLDLATARIVDLREHDTLRPFIKIFGTRLPGLCLGHFRLRDRSRAFLLVTDTSKVLVLGERSGRRLLLSLAQPQALLDALRGAADPRH
ncbi:PH domain-containing protein [Lysobacter fragariae]